MLGTHVWGHGMVSLYNVAYLFQGFKVMTNLSLVPSGLFFYGLSLNDAEAVIVFISVPS